jgi:hypothetical protein
VPTRVLDSVRRLPRRTRRSAVGALVLVAMLAATGFHFAFGTNTAAAAVFPQSAAMEQDLGVRFSRVAVVGDGGLITLTYVVLDSEKASRFQSDVTHPPVLVSESRDSKTQRVSLMKQGHTLRAGQTYYLVYQNTKAALRSGEQATIVEGNVQLPHVPVL